jgi:hypothetical protein
MRSCDITHGQHIVVNLTGRPDELEDFEDKALYSVYWQWKKVYSDTRKKFTHHQVKIINSTTRSVKTGPNSDGKYEVYSPGGSEKSSRKSA